MSNAAGGTGSPESVNSEDNELEHLVWVLNRSWARRNAFPDVWNICSFTLELEVQVLYHKVLPFPLYTVSHTSLESRRGWPLFMFLFLRAYEESSTALLAMLQVGRKVARKVRNMDFLPIEKDGFVISGGPPNYNLD